MPKIVVNRCYGGFGLSHEAILAYCARKNMAVYPEQCKFGNWTYWLRPDKDASIPHRSRKWSDLTEEEKDQQTEAWEGSDIHQGDIDRQDLDLVAVVEVLGDRANGDCSRLQVVDVPEGVDWVLEEHDGREWIAESHRCW